MVDLRMAQSEDELLDVAERSAARAFQVASGLLLRDRLRQALLRKCKTLVLQLRELCGEEPK